MPTIKQIVINNWGPKLACLILATALWYLINQNAEKNPWRLEGRASTEKKGSR